MTEQASQFLANAMAALVGALAAGAIGFFFAIRRFRHEKAFERRLEWHEETVRQLTESSERLRKIAICMQVPDLDDDLTKLFEEAIESMPNIELLMLQAEMYASRNSHKALAQARDDWGALTVANVQILNTIASREESDISNRLSPLIIDTVAKSMLHAASRLASDVRETLKLGQIDRRQGPYDDDQIDATGDRAGTTALERAKHIRAHKDRT